MSHYSMREALEECVSVLEDHSALDDARTAIRHAQEALEAPPSDGMRRATREEKISNPGVYQVPKVKRSPSQKMAAAGFMRRYKPTEFENDAFERSIACGAAWARHESINGVEPGDNPRYLFTYGWDACWREYREKAFVLADGQFLQQAIAWIEAAPHDPECYQGDPEGDTLNCCYCGKDSLLDRLRRLPA